MIDTLRSYHQHTLIGVFAEGVSYLAKTSLDTKIKNVVNAALDIIAQVIIPGGLFYLHHNLFALGFVVGFIFDKEVRILVEKVNTVFMAKRTWVERVIFFGGGGYLVLWTMPTSLITSTLYLSAQWGAELYRTSKIRSSQPTFPQHSDEHLTNKNKKYPTPIKPVSRKIKKTTELLTRMKMSKSLVKV